MTNENLVELLSEKKASELKDICDALQIAYKNENKNELAKKIVASENFKTSQALIDLATEHNFTYVEESTEAVKASGEISTDEALSIELQEECIEREIALSGEESIDELKELIAKDDAEKIEAAEWNSLKEQALQYGVNFEDGISKEDAQALINDKIAEIKAAQDKEKNDKEAEGKRRAEMKAAAIASIKSNPVSMEFINDQADVLIAAVEQMKVQTDKQKKSSDRFYRAIETLNRMKREVFIK